MENKGFYLLLIAVVLILYYLWYYWYYYKNRKDIDIFKNNNDSINKINIFASNKDDIVQYDDVDASLLEENINQKNDWKKVLQDLESDNTEIIISEKLDKFLDDNDISSSK